MGMKVGILSSVSIDHATPAVYSMPISHHATIILKLDWTWPTHLLTSLAEVVSNLLKVK